MGETKNTEDSNIAEGCEMKMGETNMEDSDIAEGCRMKMGIMKIAENKYCGRLRSENA